jgi:hypothetical protein
MNDSPVVSNSESADNSIFSYKLCWYLAYFLFFFLILWFLKTYFIPYYKTVLKDKIREYIARSHLDSSGKSIQNNKTTSDTFSNDLLISLDNIENIFGLV